MTDGMVGLQTLGSGVAIERFDEEFQRVLANALDPNTKAKCKRQVQVTVTIEPTADRQQAQIDIAVKSRLAPVGAYETRAYIGEHKGQFVAFEDDPKQVTIGEFIESNKEKVAPIKKEEAHA